jgi:hypothetical protein
MFKQIVRDGILSPLGMPKFGDTITDKNLPALKAYFLNGAWQAYEGKSLDSAKTNAERKQP